MVFSRARYRIEYVTNVNNKFKILTGIFILEGHLEWNSISKKYSNSTYLHQCRVIDLPSSHSSTTQSVSWYDNYVITICY